MSVLDKLMYLNETKEFIKDALNNNFNSQIAYLDTFRSYVGKIDDIYNNWPKITAEGNDLTLTPTRKGKIKLDLKGNIYQDTNILPEGYIQVDYIESSRSQYIDTGINADSNLRIVMDMAYSDLVTSSNGAMIGAIHSSNGTYLRYHLGMTSTAFRFQPKQGNIDISPNDTNRHIFDLNVPNGIFKVDNNSKTFTTTTYDTSVTFWLFGRNSNTDNLKAYSAQKLYNCKMYYNNILARNFVPCYRNSDNEIGLYDLVNNVFYTNQGTGDFTYGNIAIIPNPSYPQNVEVATGEQNIKIKNKNFLNFEGRTNNGITSTYNAITGEIKIKGTCSTSSGWVGISTQVSTYIPNGDFCFSTKDKKTYPIVLRLYYDETHYQDNTTINADTLSKNITVLKDTIKTQIWLRLTYNQYYDESLYLQLEQGNNQTNFEPFKETNYLINLEDIELCKIGNYQDRIYKQNNKWYLEKNISKVTLNSISVLGVNDTNSGVTTQSANGSYAILKNNISSYISNNSMYFPIVKYEYHSNITDNRTAENNLSDNTMCMRQNTNDRIYFRNSKFTGKTGNEISSLIDGLTIYYVRTSPIITEITDTTITNQLNILEQAMSYDSQTNIIQSNEKLPFIITATALLKKT